MQLDIHHVYKTYQLGRSTVQALCDINLTVQQGDFMVILGPSGSGKSTLLEIIAGLEPASDGCVLIDKKKVVGPVPETAMLFQQYSLFPWRTVLGNLLYVNEIQRKLSRRENLDKCEYYLKLVGLWEFRSAYPHQLSGGMKQKTALARALVGEPKLLLMDEPFAALDAITRYHLQIMLLSIIKKTTQKTCLFVTHSIDEALILADKIAIITARPGRIHEIFSLPENMDAIQKENLKTRIWSILEQST